MSDFADRNRRGRELFKEAMGWGPPEPVSPYTASVIDSVFGELWSRPGLSRRDRRWITLACVGASGIETPIRTHVRAALASGDVSREEFQEFVLHFAYYAGWPRASALEMAYYQAVAELDAEPATDGGP